MISPRLYRFLIDDWLRPYGVASPSRSAHDVILDDWLRD